MNNSIQKQSNQIAQLQQNLEQLNTGLFDATAHSAIILTNQAGELTQSNKYFQQLFQNMQINTLKDLPIKNTYGACEQESCLSFLTQKEEQILPKVEMLINEKLFYFTIVSTAIHNGEIENDRIDRKYIISLTDITNVVELHKNEMSISKELAYKQGIFDVTSEYIHNIGNTITGTQHLVNRIIKNLEPMQGFIKYFNLTKDQVKNINTYIKEESSEDYAKDAKRIEMSLNIIESSLTDTIKNVLETDMTALQKGINNIASTIAFQQELYKNNKVNMDEEVDIIALTKEVKSVIESQLIRNDINVEIRTEEGCTFKINRVHLYNGILNLIKNSVHALNSASENNMIENKQIVITIRNEKKEDGFFEFDMMTSDQMITSNNVIIEIEDNGIGIDATVIENLFVQGYTTKKDGHGLGLHSFANFLRGSGHFIQCVSDGIGKGAKFSIHLVSQE